MNKVKFSELVHWTPKQKEADEAVKKYKYILYGGAAGGGKSYWLRWELLKQLLRFYAHYQLKGVMVGLFCEDYPALRDRHLSKIKFEFPDWLGSYSTQDHNFTLNKEFGSGTLAFRNLDDVSKYLSAEFAVEAVDELTKNPKETFDFLRSRLRWTGVKDTKFLAGTNPGGIGMNWVKRIWIDKDFELEEKEQEKFYFIPAKVEDNPYIDKSYILSLDSLPEKLRKAYKEGNWDIFEGQYFTEWDRDKHIVKPFKIPENWKRFRTIDIGGRNGITCCYWCAVDYDGNVLVYREYYSTGRDSDEHARKITELSENESYLYTVIDNSAFDKIGLPETTAEIYIRNGVNGLVPCSKQRIMRWDIMHQYLRWDNDHDPKLRFFDVCVNAIKTIPMLIHDERHPEDVDTRGEDHAGDSIGYLLQTLRESKTPKPMSFIERRLQEIKENKEAFNFNY